MDAPPVVLGLDFGGTKTALAVAQTDGTRLGSATRDTGAGLGAAASLAGAIQAARDLLDAVAPGRRLAAVGVATIGIPGEHGVALAPNIPGWDALALGRELREAFPGAQIRLATPTEAVLADPKHPYTSLLLSAVPDPRAPLGVDSEAAKFEPPAVIDPKPGCRFRARCPLAIDECRSVTPCLRDLGPQHQAACHVATADAPTIEPAATGS